MTNIPNNNYIEAPDGELYTVEEMEPGVFQAVFPKRFADQAAVFSSAEAAWAYIYENDCFKEDMK